MIVLPDHIKEYFYIKAKNWKYNKSLKKVVYMTQGEAKEKAETNGLYVDGFDIIKYDNGSEKSVYKSYNTKLKKTEKTKYDIKKAIRLICEEMNWAEEGRKIWDYCYLGKAIQINVSKEEMSKMKSIGLRERYFKSVEAVTYYFNDTFTSMSITEHLEKHETLKFNCVLTDRFLITKEPKAVEIDDLF